MFEDNLEALGLELETEDVEVKFILLCKLDTNPNPGIVKLL